MDEKQDSIRKFLSDLPKYTVNDFIDYIPYERAAHVCSTRKELEDCLEKVYEAAKKINVDEESALFFDHFCLEDFLIEIGDKLPEDEPPEEILEIDRLKKELEEARKQLQDLSPGASENVEPNLHIVQFPTRFIPVEDESEPHEFVLGGKQITLIFGKYRVDDETGAISHFSEQGSECELCSHFLAPAAYVKIPGAGETVNIIYYRDNEWHELRDVKKSTLYDENSIAKYLIDKGIDVDQENGCLLAGYFRTLEQRNRNILIPIRKVITTLGWDRQFSSFAPYGEQNEYCTGKNQRRLISGIVSQHGSLDNWIEAIKSFRDSDHKVARIILAASFGSALIRPLNGMRFALNLIGKSGIGKSVALRMAASVWGDPDTFIASFGSTVYGALLRSNFLSDLPLILDESETKKNQTDFDEFIYTMCGDYDRVKATGDEEPATSKNCIFISGEHPLLNSNSNAGARNRVIELICDSFIFFDEDGMKRYVSLLDENYGFAGRMFVSRLIADGALQHVYEVYQKQLDYFPANRQARIPAIIMTADELTDEWLFQDGIRLVPEDLLPYLRTQEKKETLDYSEIHKKVETWIQQQVDSTGYAETEYGKVKEKRGKNPKAYIFRKGILDKLVSDIGGEIHAYLDWAKQHGVLGSGSGHPYETQQQFSIDGGKRSWYYTIYLREANSD